jgi:catechol 2,3-dioxygenase-like lactoylglutathione lyase family enzyme
MPESPLKLDHGVLHVSDLVASSRFYSEVLGAEVFDRGRDRRAYPFGGGQLSVHGTGLSAGPFARVPVVPGNSDFCFEWDGVIAGAVAHLERHGVAIELGPVERFGARGNGMSVYFRDPDGSLLEFISYSS